MVVCGWGKFSPFSVLKQRHYKPNYSVSQKILTENATGEEESGEA